MSAWSKPAIPFKLTAARLILIGLTLLGVVLAAIRFIYGMGAISNLSNTYPWGIWISLDLMTGVPLAAGAFTTCAAVYILGHHDLHPLVKPSVLTGFLGYMAVILALLVDVGRPERLYYMLFYWNAHSPLFEVGLCVMTYTTVLFCEFSPTFFEWLGWKKPERMMKKISMFFIILGVLLSTAHQSSLGTMLVMMPDKIHPLWYSPIMTAFFFFSAVCIGLAMVVVEGSIAARSYGRAVEIPLLSKLTKALPWVLGIYLALRVGDLAVAGELHLLFAPGLMTLLFWIELLVGVILPMILFSFKAIRNSKPWIIFSAVLVLAGMTMNRFDTSLVAWTRADRVGYTPSWMEFGISFGVIAGMCLVYDFVARHMNLFEDEHAKEHEHQLEAAASAD